MHETHRPDLLLKLSPRDVQQIDQLKGLALLVEEGVQLEWADHCIDRVQAVVIHCV